MTLQGTTKDSLMKSERFPEEFLRIPQGVLQDPPRNSYGVRQASRQASKQTKKQANKQTDKQAPRQPSKQRYTFNIVYRLSLR